MAARTRGSAPAAVLCAVGATALIVSLFLVWSHQLTAAETGHFRGAVLFGVPPNPDAWQVYAISAEVLAVLAIAVTAAGLWGQRLARTVALLAVATGLAFVIHAASTAPTNGLLLATGVANANHYVTDPARSGPGETVALLGLSLCALGLILSLLRLPGAAGRLTRSANL